MSHIQNSVEQEAHQRTQVGKRASSFFLQDKFILVSFLVICLMVSLVSFTPIFHKKVNAAPFEEKQDTKASLSQNMALINELNDASSRQQRLMQHQGVFPKKPTQTKTQAVVSQEILARMNAPSTFFSAPVSERTSASATADSNTFKGHDANSAFLNDQDAITSVSAKQLPHPTLTVPAGEMIPATLETAINSELAGMARAITMRDVYALSGNRLLIPKGSTLVGQFNANIAQGQSRIFVVWTRVQLTSGVVVTLNSPSADAIGRAGQGADYIDRHFFERFGSGALLSVLGAYAATGGVNGADEYNSMAQYRMNIAGNLQQAGGQTIQNDLKIAPNLQVNQGTQINVFVAHDLDFYRAIKGA